MPGISQRQLAVRRVDADHGGKPPVLYYAGIRPAEAVALRETDCQLPENGWGRLVLAKTLPVTTKKWQARPLPRPGLSGAVDAVLAQKFPQALQLSIHLAELGGQGKASISGRRPLLFPDAPMLD